MARKDGRGKIRSKLGTAGWLLGTVALGAGAGLAVERVLVGRERLKSDPHRGEPYGQLTGDRSYEVSSFDGALLAVDEIGPEDADQGVIFLHGFSLDRTIWHHQMLGLPARERKGRRRPRRRYLFYDARNHGRSRGGDAAPDTKTLARDLQAVLDQSKLRKAVLVGHSMGGMTALEFCREHPEETGRRVRGLVLVNTTYTDAVKTIFAADLIGPVERRTRRVLQWFLNDSRSSRLLRLRGDDFSWLVVRLVGFGPGASPTQIEHTQRLLTSFPSPPLIQILRGLREFDMEEALNSIDVPTLIIAGGDDRLTTVKASRRMAEEIPGARLVALDGAGHMTMMEREAEFNSLVSDFLDQVFQGNAGRRKTANGR